MIRDPTLAKHIIACYLLLLSPSEEHSFRHSEPTDSAVSPY